MAAMTSASDEKWRPFSCFFSRDGLRTYQHPCTKYLTVKKKCLVRENRTIEKQLNCCEVRNVDDNDDDDDEFL